jgi:hypothetical protein
VALREKDCKSEDFDQKIVKMNVLNDSSGTNVLHVVSTESVAKTLLETDIVGDVLVWLDCLTTGPTPKRSSLEELTRVRIRYLKTAFWWPFTIPASSDFLALKTRDQTLRKANQRNEVILWFGPTVFEQFSLMQILATLSHQEKKPHLSLVKCPRNLMAVYTAEELSKLFSSKKPISASEARFADKCWQLYCTADHIPLFNVAKRNVNSHSDLCRALLWQLWRYPAVGAGLSLPEYMLLNQIDTSRNIGWNIANTLVNDDAVLMWDSEELFQTTWTFMNAAVPLIESSRALATVRSRNVFKNLKVKLTKAGREVLSGSLDHVTLNGINRWIGGVHLTGKKVKFRWNTQRQALQRTQE